MYTTFLSNAYKRVRFLATKVVNNSAQNSFKNLKWDKRGETENLSSTTIVQKGFLNTCIEKGRKRNKSEKKRSFTFNKSPIEFLKMKKSTNHKRNYLPCLGTYKTAGFSVFNLWKSSSKSWEKIKKLISQIWYTFKLSKSWPL